ncbi:MAG: hypothetical protein WBZ36_28485 [Candidatus Nitrosopolaris sp.]
MVIQMYYENHVSRGTCKRDTCHKNDQKKGLDRYEVVGGLDDIKVKNKVALNAAQIDKLTGFLEQEGHVKEAKSFGSKWY